jgi:hypothetical protein
MLESQTATILMDHGSQRKCGDCQLCCKLLPVLSIDKMANTRCQHQRVGKGCMIYKTNLPLECGLWSCKWLTGGPDVAALKRPDRVHYVIDAMPDMIALANDEGTKTEIMVAQVWVDPAFPDAHREPGLRAWMAMIAGRDLLPTVIRWGSDRAMFVCAPTLNADGKWFEKSITFSDEKDATPRNRLIERMGGAP